jgi:regulator of chromosome condensation
LVPSQFGLPKRKIKDISCGVFHSFAIDEAGKVYSWGLNNFAQAGISENAGEGNAIISTPTVVESLAQYKIKQIQGGNHHSIACTDDHKVLVWGRCDDYQQGIPLDEIPKDDLISNEAGQPRILAKPTVVPDVSAVTVAAGIDNCLVVSPEGEAYSWGFSANYRTGLGTDDSVEEPTKLENTALQGKKLSFVGCGGQFSVVAGPAESS